MDSAWKHRYSDRTVAVIDAGEVFLATSIAVLESDHPRRRFVEQMCAHWIDCAEDGTPYSDDRAEQYARSRLLGRAAVGDVDDALIAELMNVPLEQVALRRRDGAREPSAGRR